MRPGDKPWRHLDRVLEPPTLTAYDRARRRSRIYGLICLLLAAGLVVTLFCKLRETYRAGGSPNKKIETRKH